MYSPYFIVKNRVLDGFHNSDIFETDMLFEFCKTTRSICKKTIFFSIFISTNMSDKMGCVRTCCTHHTGYAPASSNLLEKHVLKSSSHFPKKKILICFDDSPPKMMKKAFNFILKALFVLKIFKFLKL